MGAGRGDGLRGAAIEEAARILADAERVCVLTGAGVSAESGVPTFRGRDGVWKKYDPSKLATPEGFCEDPEAVWEWYRLRQRAIVQAEPNAAHATISSMASRYSRLTVVTQNVDGLHQRAGSSAVIELHGSIWRLRCTAEGVLSTISAPVEEIPPRCACGALLRPDVVWFGEALSDDVVRSAVEAASEADAMLVVGTSSVVYPAAILPSIARDAGGAVVEVNAETTPLSSFADVSVTGRAGDVLPRIWARVSTPKAL